MPLFVCGKCGAIENTALGDYWWAKKYSKDKTPLCSECMPADSVLGKGGEWHNQFPKEIATPELIREIGENNFIDVGDVEGVIAKNPCADWRKG
jgi:hypothetical protein